jgi:hypothetical protein
MPADRSLPWWAQRLIELRRSQAWSPADLARELKKRREGLPSVRSLAHMIQLDWETGKHRPGPRYRLLLAAVYDTDEGQIFGGQAAPDALLQPDEPAGSSTDAGAPTRQDGRPTLFVATAQFGEREGSRDRAYRAAKAEDDQVPDALTLAWGSTPAEVARVVTGLWEADMRRRDVIASVWAAAALSEPLGRWLLDPIDHDVACAGSRHVGRADVDAVWSMCTAFADADRRMGGGHARRTLICYADDAVAPLLTGRYTEQIGRELFAAVARLCDIAGFMCFDSDDQGLGQKYFITALRLAKTSGDQALGAHILTDMSMQAQHQQRAHEAVALADAGVAAAARSGSASALARCHAMHARALAMRGDTNDSDHALNQAERALDRAVPRSEPFWATFFTPQQLAAEAMYTASELRRATLVRLHAADALSSAEGMQRRHVMATATLAASYLPATGASTAGTSADVEQACDALRGVLPVIGSLASARALSLVSTVRSHLGAYPQVPAVQELEQDLHQCMAGASS